MPGAAGMLLQLARAAHDHFVEDAVVGAGEDGDGVAAGHRARDAHRAHHRLGAGVAERHALGVGEFGEQLGGLAGQDVLRADFVAVLDLLVQDFAQEVRLPAEQVHAESGQHVHVLVAVQVPHVRAARAFDHQLVGQFLGQRAEAVDHARIGHVARDAWPCRPSTLPVRAV